MNPTANTLPNPKMRKFESTGLKADGTPMTRGEYNELRGWDIPSNENPEDKGYLMDFGFHKAWWPEAAVVESFRELVDQTGVKTLAEPEKVQKPTGKSKDEK